MKIKLTNYDASEYQLFQDELNNMSASGYNCNSIDLFTIFKYDEQRYYYKTDIFVPKKDKNKSSRLQRDEWLLNYVNHGYEFIGKSRKIYVFKAKNKINIKGTSASNLLTFFNKNKSISNVCFIFIAMLLTFMLVPSVITNKLPSEFITNGAIILHYIPILFCITLLVRFFNHYLSTEKIKQQLSDKKVNVKISKNTLVATNWLIILSIILVAFAFINDTTSRKTKDINNDIISLKDLNLPENKDGYPTYTTSSSFLIDEAISYYEENGNDAINVSYYCYNSNDKAKVALDDYLTTINFSKTKKVTNGYLLTNDSVYNCLAFIKDKQLIIVETTTDLLKDNLYLNITK